MDTRLKQTTSRAAALAVIAVLGLGMLWAGAPSAQAGGPTSVLMANSGTGQVAAYGYGDDDYERLAAALDVFGDEPKSQPSPDVDGDFSHQIRLTWLMHDTNIWRVDILHRSPAGDWMIETRASPDGGDVWGTKPVWHRAKDPEALRAVITEAGLLEPPASPTPAPSPEAGTAGPGGAGGPSGINTAGINTAGIKTAGIKTAGIGAGALALLGAGLGGGWLLRGRWQGGNGGAGPGLSMNRGSR